jgi:hypothetical protein
VRIITRLGAWCGDWFWCVIGPKHWWLLVVGVAGCSWWLLYHLRCPKDVAGATARGLQDPATKITTHHNITSKHGTESQLHACMHTHKLKEVFWGGGGRKRKKKELCAELWQKRANH